MTEELLKRINFLAKKAKAEGLSPSEKEEQAALRAQYIKEFRQGMENTLGNVYIVDAEGNKQKVRRKGEEA